MNPITHELNLKLTLKLISAFLFAVLILFPRHGRAEEDKVPIAVQERSAESLIAALSKPEADSKESAKAAALVGGEEAQALEDGEPVQAAASQAQPDRKEKPQKNFLDESGEKTKKDPGFLDGASSGKIPWLKAVLSFLFVSSLIVILGSVVNGKLKGPKAILKNQRSARIVQTLSLGMKRQVAILDYEGTRLLIGLNGNGMQLLYAREPKAADKFNQEQALAQPAAPAKADSQEVPVAHAAPEGESINFASKIRQAMQSMKPLSGQPFPYSGKAVGKSRAGLNRYS